MALVNRMDKSNNFNQLDKMQNHMSNLITKQNEEKTDDYVVRGFNNKKDSTYFPSSSSSEDKRKTPLKGLKKQKLCNMSSSNSDNK